jgi:hypothetical protein
MPKASNIFDSNVFLCHDGEDIAFVTSINHTPKVWKIHAPSYEWSQCSYPFAEQGITCKHVMKVFKMLHPNIPNIAIVKDMGTFHEVNKDPPSIGQMVSNGVLN